MKIKFTLLDNWKTLLLKAWSIRLWALASLFEASGVVLPLFVDTMPRWMFSVLALVTAAGGIWARLIEQKGVKP